MSKDCLCFTSFTLTKTGLRFSRHPVLFVSLNLLRGFTVLHSLLLRAVITATAVGRDGSARWALIKSGTSVKLCNIACCVIVSTMKIGRDLKEEASSEQLLPRRVNVCQYDRLHGSLMGRVKIHIAWKHTV